MAEHSAKRPRTNTEGASAAPLASSDAVLEALPTETLRALLQQAARQHADVAAAVTAAHDKAVAVEQARVVDFDYLSKAAWRALNVTYRRQSQSRQFEAAGAAADEVRRCIDTIATQSRAPASFGTRRSGLETLRKIGKSVVLAGSAGETLGREVVKLFQFDACLEDAMHRIARGFSAQERELVMADGEMETKLEELEELGRDEFVFERLPRVRQVLLGLDAGVVPGSGLNSDGDDKRLEDSESSESSESEESEESEEDDDDE